MEENIRILIKRRLQEHNRMLGEGALGEGEMIEAVRELYQMIGEHGFLKRYGENIPLLLEDARMALRARGRLKPVLVEERIKLIPVNMKVGAGIKAVKPEKGLIKKRPVLKKV